MNRHDPLRLQSEPPMVAHTENIIGRMSALRHKRLFADAEAKPESRIHGHRARQGRNHHPHQDVPIVAACHFVGCADVPRMAAFFLLAFVEYKNPATERFAE